MFRSIQTYFYPGSTLRTCVANYGEERFSRGDGGIDWWGRKRSSDKGCREAVKGSGFIAVISQRSGRYLVPLARTINSGNVAGSVNQPAAISPLSTLIDRRLSSRRGKIVKIRSVVAVILLESRLRSLSNSGGERRFSMNYSGRQRRVDGAPRLQATFMHPESSRFPPRSRAQRRMSLDAVSVRRTPTRQRNSSLTVTNSYAHLVIGAPPPRHLVPAL